MYDFTSLPKRKNSGAYKWAEVEQMYPDNDEIVPLSVADLELLNAPEITSGLKTFLDENSLGYGIATDSYFDSVCQWMKRRHNWNVKKEWILEWNGVVTAFYDAIALLTSPGDKVMLLSPVYYPFYTAITGRGRQVADVPLLFRDNRYEIDFDLLEKTARDPKTKVMLLCSPHNPIGRVWTREELIRLGRICVDNNVLVVSDEIHFDLIMPGYEHTVFASISEEFAQNCIVCTAPSKTFGLPGLQASNVIVPNKELRNYLEEEHKKSGFIVLGVLGYKACEIAYSKCSQWLDEFIALLERNRKTLCAFLEEDLPQIHPIRLEGTYLQWVDCRELPWRGEELSNRLKKDAGLFFDDGYVFGESGDGFERINLACPTVVLIKALERWKKAADQWKRSGRL